MKNEFKELLSFANSGEYPIGYIGKYREGIDISDGSSSYIVINYCPITGKKLPDSLRDEWFEEIHKMGLEPGDPNIPKEYLDETWWLNNS